MRKEVGGISVLHDFSAISTLNIEYLQFQHVKVGRDWHYTLCDSFNRLYFVLDGEGTLYLTDKTITLTPGHWYLVPAGLPFSCHCSTYLEKIFLHFKCSILPDHEILSALTDVIELPISKELMSEVRGLLKAGGVFSDLKIRVHFENVITDQLQPLEEIFREDISLYRRFEPFFTYTSTHLKANLTIGEICANIGMTPRQLSYQYKNATGQSIKSHLNYLLQERIKYYLLTTNLSVKKISEELQFNNEFYCSRFFKKCVGMSPKEYRQINMRPHSEDEVVEQ